MFNIYIANYKSEIEKINYTETCKELEDLLYT